MVVVHLTASRFFGGPERQMLGLAQALAHQAQTAFLSFSEEGHCTAFLDRVSEAGFEADPLRHDTPHLAAAVSEIKHTLRQKKATVLCCHGYKAILLGRLAARQAGVPAIAVSRGWTYESPKVKLYEALERLSLRWMDRVVCVSQGQAAKVLQAGVPAARVVVIPNAIRADRFESPTFESGRYLQSLFPEPVKRIVGAAGRLSPEKGFHLLVEAADALVRRDPTIGFVLFGEGPLRASLADLIAKRGLEGRFLLAGFRPDLDALIPHLDLMVLPSFTEGMPNVVLEAFAAGVPVVATAVGGTPEIVEHGINGYLVPSGNSAALSNAIAVALAHEPARVAMGRRGRSRVRESFTFDANARSYLTLFEEVLGRRPAEVNGLVTASLQAGIGQ